MWNHKTVWGAIDALAARHELTPSGLAKKAGLDPTAFNPSKRRSADGRPRWPSTESIAKILRATDANLDEFFALVQQPPLVADRVFDRPARVPMVGLAQAGAGGFFDDGGYPAGHGWDQVEVPAMGDEGTYALRVMGDSMLPLYRDGDVIIVSPAAPIRRGDRVVVKTAEDEVTVKVLKKRTAKVVELHAINTEHSDRVLPVSEIKWMARIVWASQ